MLTFAHKFPITIAHAKGVHLFDTLGKKYLDLTSGIATVNFGHCNEHIASKISQQLYRLWHCSNLFSNELQEQAAERLVNATSFGEKIFFCSSGLEAIEAAVKFIRRYFHETGHTGKTEIITLKNGFHGRSITGISAGGTEAARRGFAPLLEGFTQVEANDTDVLHTAVSHRTAAVILELIQSEGGVHEITQEYVNELNELREKFNFLLCFDEIQTGFGRIGKLFHYENLRVEPDLLTCAKGMGNGFPVGGCIVNQKIAANLPFATHGGTYSGNSLAMAAVNGALDLLNEKLFKHVESMSSYFMESLHCMAKLVPEQIIEIRGRGLLIGVELATHIDSWDFMNKCLKSGVAITRTSKPQVLRILPPLIITKEDVDFAIEVLYKNLRD